MSWKLILISDGLGEEWLSVCIRLCSFLVEAVFTSGPTVIWHQILLPISMSISWCWILNSMQSCSFPSIFKVYPILMILPYLWHSLVFGLCSCCAQILLIFSVPVLWIWSFFWFDGSQTVHAYFTVGLTMVVYAADFTGFVQSLRFRRINPSVLFPLPTMLSMCLSR